MTKLFLALLLFTGAAYGQAADGPKEPAMDEEFTLKVGQKVTLKDTNLTVRFLAVAEDSRCPVDVTCVWAGNARLEFELLVSDQNRALVSLNTGVEPKAAQLKKFKLKLVGLTPGKKEGRPLNPADYEATVIVGKRDPRNKDN